METFSALLAICVGNTPVSGEFPAQRPVTWSFDISFDLRLNKRLSKQSWGWWFETLSCPLWCQCNGIIIWTHKRRSISHPDGWDMDRLLWGENYLIGHVIMKLDFIVGRKKDSSYLGKGDGEDGMTSTALFMHMSGGSGSGTRETQNS